MIWHHDYGISHISAYAKVSSICQNCYQRHTECSQILRRMTFFCYKEIYCVFICDTFDSIWIFHDFTQLFSQILFVWKCTLPASDFDEIQRKTDTFTVMKRNKKICEENEKNGKSDTPKRRLKQKETHDAATFNAKPEGQMNILFIHLMLCLRMDDGLTFHLSFFIILTFRRRHARIALIEKMCSENPQKRKISTWKLVANTCATWMSDDGV